MKFVPRKFQVGGQMEAPVEEAPVEEAPTAPEELGGQDPLMMIAQAAAQALQSLDCQMAMQVCQAFIQLILQAQGGGAPAPEEALGTPIFGKGGVLKRRIKK